MAKKGEVITREYISIFVFFCVLNKLFRIFVVVVLGSNCTAGYTGISEPIHNDQSKNKTKNQNINF